TLAARGFFGYLDLCGGDEQWVPPRTHHELPEQTLGGAFDAPQDNPERAVTFPAQAQPPPPPRTFRFLMSDFLLPFSDATWVSALERRWDIIPVVIQDPVWERSFPEVGGVALPFLDHTTGRFVSVRLTDREAAWMRDENERRATELLARFRTLDLG